MVLENKIAFWQRHLVIRGKLLWQGLRIVPGTEIIVFYPKDGVSKVQELQMTTQTGDNTHVMLLMETLMMHKQMWNICFNDVALREKLAANKLQFSSANSMNIGRLVPQIVYYVLCLRSVWSSLVRLWLVKRSTSQYRQETLEISWLPFMLNNWSASWQINLCFNDNNVLTDFFKPVSMTRNVSLK